MMSDPRWAQAFDGIQHLAGLGITGGLVQQRHGHQDGLQDVVQVVGDAAGQRANALHALGAAEIGFKLLPLRDVRVDGQDLPGRFCRSRTRVQRQKMMISFPALLTAFN